MYFGTDAACCIFRSAPTGLPTGSSPHSTYVVFSQDFSQETRAFGWGNNTAIPGGRHSLGVTTTGAGGAVCDGLYVISTIRPINSMTPYIYSSHYGSGLLYSQMPTYLNGVYDMGYYIYNGTLNIGLDTIGIGMIPGYTGGYFLTGYVAEAILYNVLHTTEERSQVHGYLSAKYGIAI
jgi:hypothetical protein